jgi:hypothetical protein
VEEGRAAAGLEPLVKKDEISNDDLSFVAPAIAKLMGVMTRSLTKPAPLCGLASGTP